MSHRFVSDEQLHFFRAALRAYKTERLSYGVVRDYCESADLLPNLSSYQGDIKDQQRCWMLKAILANVPTGSRLVEIGAGEPIVADILGRLGYSVAVVDPYTGAGNGPTSVEEFRTAYSNVTFIVDWFSPDLKE